MPVFEQRALRRNPHLVRDAGIRELARFEGAYSGGKRPCAAKRSLRYSTMGLPEGFAIRCATTADLDTLVAHRREMFRDMGYEDEAALDSMAARFRVWLLERMNAGDYRAWLVEAADGSIAAGTGLWLMDWIPHMVGKSALRGNILNVYTSGNFRRRGLARELMETALAWCRENGIDTIILHASPFGRALYESMGFTATNEMRIRF